MTVFCLILDPPGREVDATELDPLLAPIAYLGCHGRRAWAGGNLAIGCLHNTKPVTSDRTGYPHHAIGGRFTLVADARLDAHDDLCAALDYTREAAARVSDEELLLAAYLRWGKDCARHLLGDFAFVVFDRQTQELYGCADAVGARRLFYGELASGRFLLASEEACLLAVPELTRTWSETGLAYWLACSLHRELSLFEGIRVLSCGRHLERVAAVCQTTRWWDYQSLPAIRYHRLEDYAEHYRSLLQRAVADRMLGRTGPVLCELSGGMDSSTITASAVAATGGDREQVITLSCLYPGFNSCNEAALITLIRQQLGITKSIELDGSAMAMAAASDPSPIRPESPLALNSVGQQCIVREAAGRGCQVILTGHGGDELTAGAPIFATMERLRRGDLSVIGETFTAARARGISLPSIMLHQIAKPTLRLIMPPGILRPLLDRRAVANRFPPWLRHDRPLIASVGERMRHHSGFSGLDDYQQALVSRLRRSTSWAALDAYRLNAAAGPVDVRTPFLDRRLLEFALGLAPDLWFRRGFRKFLPRFAFSRILPYDVCWSPKKVVFDEVGRSGWGARRVAMSPAIAQARSQAEPSSAVFRMMPGETALDLATSNMVSLNYAFFLAAWINQQTSTN